MCVARGRDWLAGAKKKKITSGLWPRSGPKLWTQGAQRGLYEKPQPETKLIKNKHHTHTHTAGGRRWLGAWQSAGVRQGLDSTRCEWRNVRRAFILKFDVVVDANKH